MKYFCAILGLAVVAVLSVFGFRGDFSRKPPLEIFPDMDRQPKLRPLASNPFFANRRTSQPLVPGTIARGWPIEDTPVNTGRVTGTTNWVDTIPVPVTGSLMARGRERFQINCSPCHGAAGDGRGVITRYGMVAVANFHDPRLVKMAAGEIFNTITHGKNLMGPYGANVEIADRWAIIAYIRVLQRSRLGTLDDVPESKRSALQQSP